MRLFISTIVVAALVAAAGTADAQVVQAPRPERPYRGLFGGDTGNAGKLLTFSASFGGGYDDDIFATDSGGAPPSVGVGTAQPSSTFLIGNVNLGYSEVKSKLSFQLNGGSGVGHYPSLDNPQLVHHNASASVAYQIGRHATVSASQQENYQPFYFWAWLPTSIAPVDPTPIFDPGTMTISDAVQAASLGVQQPVAADAVAAGNAEYYLSSDTDLSYQQGLTQRMTLGVSYAYRRTDGQSGLRDFQTQSGSAGLKYLLSKGLSLRAEYGYSDTRYPGALGPTEYTGSTINAGVDFNKALSFSRRTRLSFSTGTAAVNDGVQTHYTVTGDVYLTREIGRSWMAGIGYNRNVYYTETFLAPVLSDTASASLEGLFSRTTQFQATVGLSRGDIGFGTVGNGFRSLYSTAGIRFAFTRNMGLSLYYGYFKYDFENRVVLPLTTARSSNRQTISFSVDFWKPLIQRNRS